MQQLNLTSPYELVFKRIHNAPQPADGVGRQDGSFLSHHPCFPLPWAAHQNLAPTLAPVGQWLDFDKKDGGWDRKKKEGELLYLLVHGAVPLGFSKSHGNGNHQGGEPCGNETRENWSFKHMCSSSPTQPHNIPHSSQCYSSTICPSLGLWQRLNSGPSEPKAWTLVTSANEVNAISCNQLISCCGLSSCVGTDSTCRCIKYIYFILGCTGWPGIYKSVSWRWNIQPQPNSKKLARRRWRAMFALNIMYDEQPRFKPHPKWDRKGNGNWVPPIPNRFPQCSAMIYNRAGPSEQQWKRASEHQVFLQNQDTSFARDLLPFCA